MCRTCRARSASWCASSMPPGSRCLPWLIQQSSWAKLLFQTWKIFSTQRGWGLRCKNFCCIFWTLWWLRRQGAENKGWNWTTRGREPREAPSFLPSNQWSLFCLAASLQLPHELCPCPLLPYSPSSPSQGLSSPSPPCNIFGCCKLGRDAQLFSSSWAMSSSFPGFPSAGLPFSGAPGDSRFSVQINAHPTLCSLSLRAWEINIEEHSGAEIAPIRLKAPVSLDVYPRSYGGIAKSPPCFCFPFLHSLLFLPYPIWYLSDTVLLPPELLIRKR